MRPWLLLVPLTTACVIVTETDKDIAETDDTGITTTTETGEPPTETGDTGLGDPDADMDGFPASEDCDDDDPAVNPGALDVCDGIDNDCSGTEDDDGAATLGGVNYSALDEAIAAAVDGDTIDVCPGDHLITAWTISAGTYGLVGSMGRDDTSIAESTGATVFALTDTGALTLDGVSVTGSAAVDAAITVDDEASLTLMQARIHDNTASGISIIGSGAGAMVVADETEIMDNDATGLDGGGIRAFGGFDIALSNSSLSGNTADNGGAIYASATFGIGQITASTTTITGNTAGSGGGVMILNVPLDADGATSIDTNVATIAGGGVASVVSPVTGVEIAGNSAAMGGGFAALYDPAFVGAPLAPDLVNCSVSGNTGDQGAGIWVDRQQVVTVSSAPLGTTTTGYGISAVIGNVATVEGGGAYLTPQGTLESIGTDWAMYGSGDNTPDDVWTPAGAYPNVGTDFLCTGQTGCL